VASYKSVKWAYESGDFGDRKTRIDTTCGALGASIGVYATTDRVSKSGLIWRQTARKKSVPGLQRWLCFIATVSEADRGKRQ
jgi:hypothetical protein